MSGRVPWSLRLAATAVALYASGVALAAQQPRMFATPEEAVQALAKAARAKDPAAVKAIFGADAKGLVDTSDPVASRQNRQVFAAAFKERWKLVDREPAGKTLVVGNEDWPFPVPLVSAGGRWHFDAAAGHDEILSRRIGRNELGAIQFCRTYVHAQQLYARDGHDGQPAGLYAMTFRSDAGKQNGLYWAAAGKHAKISPLGDLVAAAGVTGQRAAAGGASPTPFHGYYFAILTAQGAAAPGGAKSYVADGRMSGGFALVAWPAEYGASGITSFIVGADGIVRERDLGPHAKPSPPVKTFDPDAKWAVVP